MGMTMTQKILAAHAGLTSVEAGQLIECDLDIVMGNDVTTPVAIREFEKAGIEKVFIPQDNVEDLEDVAEEVKERLTIIPVRKIRDVLDVLIGE